jgi:hypothetical protein
MTRRRIVLTAVCALVFTVRRAQAQQHDPADDLRKK